MERIEIWQDVIYTLRLGNLNDGKCHCGIGLKEDFWEKMKSYV